MEQVNCLQEANLILQTLQNYADKSAKEMRLTANKLVDLVYGQLNGRSSNKASNNLTKTEIEQLILTMVMRKYLQEDFHFTPYNTICYVICGPRANRLAYESEFNLDVSLKGDTKSSQNSKIPAPQVEKSTKVNTNTSKKHAIVYQDDEDDDDVQFIFDPDDDLSFPDRKKSKITVIDDD